MGRFRGPKFALEFLEGRLSPSTMIVNNPAEYDTYTATEDPAPAPYGSTTPVNSAPNSSYPGYPA